MKTSTLLLLGGAAAVGYFYWKNRTAAISGAAGAVMSPTVASTGTDASAADIAAATDATQAGANAIVPSVIVVQPDDSYDAFCGNGWGSPWGGFYGGGRGHHHHGGGHHRGRH